MVGMLHLETAEDLLEDISKVKVGQKIRIEENGHIIQFKRTE